MKRDCLDYDGAYSSGEYAFASGTDRAENPYREWKSVTERHAKCYEAWNAGWDMANVRFKQFDKACVI